MSGPIELSVVMPCLNEADTVAICVKKAVSAMAEAAIVGEVVVADNGSTDGSQALAIAEGARIVDVAERGYGVALMHGIEASKGKYVLMGDADASYDFLEISKFIESLCEGHGLVHGGFGVVGAHHEVFVTHVVLILDELVEPDQPGEVLWFVR